MKNKVKKYSKKFERYLKTFVEAFISYMAVSVATVDITSKQAIYGLIAGALGSALSVLLNIDKKGGDK